MHRVQCLVITPTVSLVRYDHAPGVDHCDDSEEECSTPAINFVESGSFELEIEMKRWRLGPGAQFMSRPGTVHRYRHRHGEASDVCLSARYAASFAEEDAFGRYGPIMPNNRVEFLKLRLAAALETRDLLAIENWACDLLAALRPAVAPIRLYRARQLKWYAQRIEAARMTLDREFAEQHLLSSLARQVGMSTFQFARIFRELIGIPPHRYLSGVRLNHARQLLRSGVSVTATCYESGFANLSHFIRSFRRRFGYLPSAVKKQSK